jgi:hypothetical protein
VVCGLWFVVCGLWFVVCGLWFVPKRYKVGFKQFQALHSFLRNPHSLIKPQTQFLGFRLQIYSTFLLQTVLKASYILGLY